MGCWGVWWRFPRWWAEGDGLEDCPTPSVMDRREGAAPRTFAETLRAPVSQLLPTPAPTHHPTVIVPAPAPPPSHHINVVTMGPASVINSVSTSRQNLDTIVQVPGPGERAVLGGFPLGTGPLGED